MNNKVGKVRMEILALQPTPTPCPTRRPKPFEGNNVTDFIFNPEGADTWVNWVITRPTTLTCQVS